MPQVMQNELFALLAEPNDTTSVLRSIAKNSAERTYLSTLKWVFGVHKKTSNAAIWGDSGMYPLLIKTSKQVFNYFCRVTAVDFNEGIAKDAVAEQKALGLSWFSTLEKAHETISGALPSHQRSSSIALKPGAKFRSHLEECFRKHWETERRRNHKLNDLYNNCKHEFGMEAYVRQSHKCYHKSLAAIRMSSHNLHIETGRHTSTSRHRRICRGCVTDDINTIEGFLNLPECVLQLEDEIHVLFDCEYYSDVRNHIATEDLRLSMLSSPAVVFKDEVLVRNLSKLATAVLNKHRLLIRKDVKEKPTNQY